ncbi:hypothetical protein B0H16DRAFT_1569407 [Mycena metata]|uniref:Uncharacterized protein n=1 Tax=Mycena metata TaxID=1033252 RepID=A0AAD7N0L0_9AGAR|nr:hypothetical protein B0H16DRAFT_1569407 [Mycena metata]
MHLSFFQSWTRLCVGGIALVVVLLLIIPRYAHPSLTLTLEMDDALAQKLRHPTFLDIREYQRKLPQHVQPGLVKTWGDRPRYLFFKDALWDSGWNNVLQEQLLNTHLAYLSHRAYVFPSYVARAHPPFPDTLEDGTRHLLRIPMNAFVSGPTGGGPLSADGTDQLMRRAVAEEWWDTVCPKEQVVVVKFHDVEHELRISDKTDGAEVFVRWAKKLREMPAPCISVEGGPVFNYLFVGSHRVLSVWPTYGVAPTLKYFAWSPLIAQALSHNFHILSPAALPASLTPFSSPSAPLFPSGAPSPPAANSSFASFRPYHPSAAPIAGLLGLHVRRGDFKAHCVRLADAGWEYNAWSLLGTPAYANNDSVWPALPDYLDVRVAEGETRHKAAMRHCWPSREAMVQRVRDVRAGAGPNASSRQVPAQELNRIYISTDASRAFVLELTADLQAEGWEVFSSFDLELNMEQQAVAQAVDMSVLVAAEEFVGVGFSSLTSNVVQLRLASGREARTTHFW